MKTRLPHNVKRWASEHRRALAALVGLCVVAAGVYYGYVLLVRRPAERQRLVAAEKTIADYEAAIKSAGEPIALEDLARPKVADEDNAAAVIQRAIDLSKSLRSSDDSLDIAINDPDRDAKMVAALKAAFEAADSLEPDPLDPDTIWWDPDYDDGEDAEKGKAAFIEALPQYDEVVRLLEQALERPRCVFEPLTPETRLPIPHLVNMRHFARHLIGRALVAAEAGEADLAVLRLSQVFCLASLLNEDPPIISQLVAIALYGMGLNGLRMIESSVPLTPEARRAMLQRLNRIDAADAMTRSILNERAIMHIRLQALLSADTLPENTPGDVAQFLEMPGKLALREGHVHFLQIATHIIDASRMKPERAALRLRILDDRIEKPEGLHQLLFAGTLRSMVTSAVKHIRTETYLRAARIGLAYELYRGDKGAYPKDSSALAPEYLDTVPIDPFSGKPYVIEHRGSELIVRGIGPNGVDDGGDLIYSPTCDDIAWRCGAPAKQKR